MAKSRSAGPADERAGDHLSERLDRDMAARAYRKVMAGEQPSERERAALKRFEKEQEEQRRWSYYESIPQKHWRRMSGRQTKVLKEQAERYGLPFGERTIDLPKVVRALHDFLAENARRLATEEDDLMQGAGSPALERYREERARLARLDRLERERELLPRETARDALTRIATLIRGAGETLQRRYGREAVDVLDEALDDAQREIDAAFRDDGEGVDAEPDPA